MTNSVKPWHDAPKCPECSAPAVTPMKVSEDRFAGPAHLFCAACGEDWIEERLETIAQAWWSHGAYEGKEAAELARRKPFWTKKEAQ